MRAMDTWTSRMPCFCVAMGPACSTPSGGTTSTSAWEQVSPGPGASTGVGMLCTCDSSTACAGMCAFPPPLSSTPPTLVQHAPLLLNRNATVDMPAQSETVSDCVFDSGASKSWSRPHLDLLRAQLQLQLRRRLQLREQLLRAGGRRLHCL
jgi:hypothetical protein